MFGSRSIKIIIAVLAISTVLSLNVSASDLDNQPQGRISVNEEFGDYMSVIRDKISKSWNPPDVLEDGHASVVFKLDKNGNVLNAYIRETSGNKVYDDSALASIQHAAPYAHFPKSTNRETITIQYAFDSSIVKTDYVKELVQQSEKYINKDNETALKYIDKALKEIEGDPAAYFLYARRYKINKLIGNTDAAKLDLAECKRLKAGFKAYDGNQPG